MSKRLNWRCFRQTDDEYADLADTARKLGVGVSELLRGATSLCVEAVKADNDNPVTALILERVGRASRITQHGAVAR